MRDLIALMTDFGHNDNYVGVMKGVILGINPGARIVDLTHGVEPQDIRQAAFLLGSSWEYFPKGTVFCCVIDPGVGTNRRAIAAEAGGRFFVGPDNGILTEVMDASLIEKTVVLDNAEYHLLSPGATFHGRDVFAPAAAHLSKGMPIGSLGTELSVWELKKLQGGKNDFVNGMLKGKVIHIDNFGNLITSIKSIELNQFKNKRRPTAHQASIQGMGCRNIGSQPELFRGASQRSTCLHWQQRPSGDWDQERLFAFIHGSRIGDNVWAYMAP